MKSALYRLPIAVVTLVALVATMSAKTDWDKASQRRKAEYIFLESQNAYATKDLDRYVTLLERAYALDSTDLEIANDWAWLTMQDDNADSATIAKAYDLTKRYYTANPTDYISGVMFANIAHRLGHYDDMVSTWEMLDSVFPNRPDISLKRADSYLMAFAGGDSTVLDKAEAIYGRIEEGSGRSIQLTQKKIYLYTLKNDTLAVINELDSLYASAPSDAYTSLFVGVTFQYLDMPERSIKYLDRACALDSTFGAAYLSRARFYLEQNDSVAYDREVFHALRSPNLDFDSKMEILRSYVSELYTDPAQETRLRQLFDELQQMHSGEPKIHELYGAYLYELDDFVGATEQFSYMAALAPSDESAWLLYVQTAAKTDDMQLLIKSASEASERFPENLYFPLMHSNVYHIEGDPAKAIEILESVEVPENANPSMTSILFTALGDSYASMGDTIMALEKYDRALEYDPNYAMALNNAAYFITLSHGDLDKAEKYSARSLQGDELNPTYLDTYAWVFFAKKDYSMAKQYIDIALNSYEQMISPDADAAVDNDELILPHGATEQEVDSSEEMVEVAEESIDDVEEDMKGLSADIYDHAGDIYFMNGEAAQALEFWKKALELDPENELIKKKVEHKTIFLR